MTFPNPLPPKEGFLPAYDPHHGFFYEEIDKCEYWSCDRSASYVVFENDTPSRIHLLTTQGDGHMMNLCEQHSGEAEKEMIDKCPTDNCFNIKPAKYQYCIECNPERLNDQYSPEFSPKWKDQKDGLFHVYVLSLSDKSFYIGHTSDLRVRMTEHRSHKEKGTSGTLPPLVWFTPTPSRESATALEVDMKRLRDKNDRNLRKMILEFSDLVKETYWYKQGESNPALG